MTNLFQVPSLEKFVGSGMPPKRYESKTSFKLLVPRHSGTDTLLGGTFRFFSFIFRHRNLVHNCSCWWPCSVVRAVNGGSCRPSSWRRCTACWNFREGVSNCIWNSMPGHIHGSTLGGKKRWCTVPFQKEWKDLKEGWYWKWYSLLVHFVGSLDVCSWWGRVVDGSALRLRNIWSSEVNLLFNRYKHRNNPSGSENSAKTCQNDPNLCGIQMT